ncbi:hypothetical protein HLB35_15755 [Halomonas sp. TBZ9]|uniref:Uncharacterized protein n=1 Tax=Vreelandella azerica TaxID=2732867 RepID=A0A7Y3XC21_9GAMM|nr:hypothetical protein [Halomonas azerica]NOG32850.1 hypothetical protein [Halomonas azerica]
MPGNEQLDTAPYLVVMKDEAARLYARMRELEDEWLEACERRGCTLVRSGRRQCVVLTPQPAALPDLDIKPYTEWAEAAAKLAEEQGKKDSVGSRSSQAPTWITLDGARSPLSEAPPNYYVQRLRYRTAQAARGARLGPDDALEYIRGLVARASSSLDSSYKHGHKDRVSKQKERLARLQDDLTAFQKLVTTARQQNLLISVQALSGKAWKITARTSDKNSISTSVTTIAAMPCTADVLVEPAGSRNRSSRAIKQVDFEHVRVHVSLYERA